MSSVDVEASGGVPAQLFATLFSDRDLKFQSDIERAVVRQPPEDVVALCGPDAGQLFCVNSHEDTEYTWKEGLPLLYLLHKSVFAPNGIELPANDQSSHHQRVKVRSA